VLDFARPVRFQLAPVDLNAVCSESAGAAQQSGPGAPVHLALDRFLPQVTTDAERLRSALVNMLVNARHAVTARQEALAGPAASGQHLPPATLKVCGISDGRGASSGSPEDVSQVGQALSGLPEPAITLRTEARGDRIAIVIEDRGIGIEPADLSRMFDPYFTTKRGGTGLGLAIAKNIIEGLHGTIAVTSAPGAGTAIHIDLPADAARVTDH
jgi:signal transduction histidine kinase